LVVSHLISFVISHDSLTNQLLQALAGPYIPIDPPTFTESGRFALSLAKKPCKFSIILFYVKESSQYDTPDPISSQSGAVVI
jgi:hypothetical protein